MVECPRRAGGSRAAWVTESLGAIEIGTLGSRDLIKISLALLFSLPPLQRFPQPNHHHLHISHIQLLLILYLSTLSAMSSEQPLKVTHICVLAESLLNLFSVSSSRAVQAISVSHRLVLFILRPMSVSDRCWTR